MPVLQLDDQQFPLPAGATRIGAGTGVDIAVPGDPSLGALAIIDGGGAPAIRRASDDAQVRVNGLLLGAEPTPLMHGDKVELAGVALRYADDSKSGATQFVSAAEIAAMTGGAKRTGAARETVASGGRLVSLVDGKEYTVSPAGLVIGREAACDVVVAQNEVSRRHAEIAPGEQGYMVRDTSANGVFVNGERVQGSHRLARADVLRVGSEEFRFYADVVAPTAKSPAAAPLGASEPAAAPEPPRLSASDFELVVDAPEPVKEPVAAVAPAAVVPAPPAPPAPAVVPAAPAAPAPPVPDSPREERRPLLATLESLNEGPAKGTKHELHTALAHVGRGAHNDIRLQDESVSETHAKLQRRDDGWYVVDMDSTNGTYVGGSRVKGERRLDGAPDVRFGGLKMRFSAVGTGGASDLEAKGTRAIAAVDRRPTVAPSAAPSAAASSAAPASAPVASVPEKKSGIPVWIWAVVIVVLAAVAFFVLKGGS